MIIYPRLPCHKGKTFVNINHIVWLLITVDIRKDLRSSKSSVNATFDCISVYQSNEYQLC